MLHEYNGIVPPRFHRAVNNTMTNVLILARRFGGDEIIRTSPR